MHISLFLSHHSFAYAIAEKKELEGQMAHREREGQKGKAQKLHICKGEGIYL